MREMKADSSNSARNEASFDNNSKSTDAYAKYIVELQSKVSDLQRNNRELQMAAAFHKAGDVPTGMTEQKLLYREQ